MFTVYILLSISTNKFYVGHTANLHDRLRRHNSGRSKATKSGAPWKVVYTKNFQTKSEAYQYELKIDRAFRFAKSERSPRFNQGLDHKASNYRDFVVF